MCDHLYGCDFVYFFLFSVDNFLKYILRKRASRAPYVKTFLSKNSSSSNNSDIL